MYDASQFTFGALEEVYEYFLKNHADELTKGFIRGAKTVPYVKYGIDALYVGAASKRDGWSIGVNTKLATGEAAGGLTGGAIGGTIGYGVGFGAALLFPATVPFAPAAGSALSLLGGSIGGYFGGNYGESKTRELLSK